MTKLKIFDLDDTLAESKTSLDPEISVLLQDLIRLFEDHSKDILQEDTIVRLMTFKNVLITSHQAFLTETAPKNITDTTMYNLSSHKKG
jgi:FMN phosphatase YigB (HAD superfamily)